jgi:hypothetical protein
MKNKTKNKIKPTIIKQNLYLKKTNLDLLLVKVFGGELF